MTSTFPKAHYTGVRAPKYEFGNGWQGWGSTIQSWPATDNGAALTEDPEHRAAHGIVLEP